MSAKIYGHYPLGFRRVLRPGERKLDSAPDDNVTAEYVRWQQDRAGSRSWATHENAIKLGISMFGDFKNWLREQQDNPNLSPHAWNFLLETIRFINTGERRINVFTHTSLILMDVEMFHRMPMNDRKVYLSDVLLPSSDTVFTHWLRQPNGFNDMLCSLAVFFGNTQPKGSVTWAS